MTHDCFLVTRRSIKPSANSGCTQVSFKKQLRVRLETRVLFAQGHCKRSHLLAKSHGNSILKLRTPHGQNVAEFFSLCIKSCCEIFDSNAQPLDFTVQSQTERRWIGIVSGLRVIDVIVGINDRVVPPRQPHHFECTVGDNFVRVHIDACPRTTLELIDWELVHTRAIRQNVIACGNNRISRLCANHSQFTVRQRTGFLHLDDGTNQFRNLIDTAAADLIVLKSSQSMNPPICIIRNLTRAQQIFFDTCHLLSP